MSVQPIEHVDLDVIEALDFDPPCEHSVHGKGIHGHSGTAWALVAVLPCLACGHGGDFLICRGGWDAAKEMDLVCHCGSMASRDECWRIVALVRP